MEHRDSIRFVLDDEPITVAGADANRSLLQYLREDLGHCGTKEGCAEGDCGACTVLLGESADDGTVSYRSVNACIRLLPTVDGREVVTVEGLSRKGAPLHPVQQAMVDCHGSQCGFCTPGFVMSLAEVYLAGGPTDRDSLANALAGNLCRCTGYRPILDAGARMDDYPQPDRWSRADARSETRARRLARMHDDTALALRAPRRYAAPRTVDDLARERMADPDAVLLAGGTDVGLWINKQLHDLTSIIYVGDIPALRRVEARDEALIIGAAASLTDAYETIAERYPDLRELYLRFASPPIRNAGTLGGNIANGSPIGDSMPVLLALDAELILRRGDQRRTVALADFYTGYQQTVLQPGEFLESVRIPHATVDTRIAGYKISKRRDQDISAVCAGFAVRTGDDGRIHAARIGFGGMAATPARAPAAEAALIGRPWAPETFAEAGRALGEDFQPISDMRATAAYRLRVASNLLQRFCLEHGDSPVATRLAANGKRPEVSS